MNQEFPSIDQDKMVSPHAQEIEYALILQRMIETVKNDPSQMRLAIYEFARAKLKVDSAWADLNERERLTKALETAIQGVEQFSARRDDRERLQAPYASAQIAHHAPAAELGPGSGIATTGAVTPAPQDILMPSRAQWYPDIQPVIEVRTRALLSTLARFCIGVALLGGLVALAYYKQGLPLERASTKAAIADASQQTPVADAKVATAQAPPFPLPSDYGVYALSNDSLSELFLLPARVPDGRIAMSTPVSQPSRTTLPDGKAKFILFRRDLIGNAPDRVEVRVVARVVRALTFDAKGKPNFASISDAWNVRNISYEFRVRPIPGNPEMLLVQSDKADFTLSPGRYVLVLNNQGYDFTVAGNVTDLAQCLERTDAANGEFYSECQKL